MAKKAIVDVRDYYEPKLSYLLSEIENVKKKISMKETGFPSSANSNNEHLDLEKNGRPEPEYRPSSAPPAPTSNLLNGLLSPTQT